MTTGERGAAALEAVRSVFPDAKWLSKALFLGRQQDAIHYQPYGPDMWVLDIVAQRNWHPDELRVVLRALDILNGVNE